MRRSIKSKLQLSFTGIFLALTALVCLFWYKTMGDMAREQAVRYVNSSVDSMSAEFDSLMKDASYISLILSFNAIDQSQILSGQHGIETYRELESDRILTRSVNDFYSYRSYISSILLYGVNGRVFSNGVVLAPEEIAVMPWFEALDGSGEEGVFIRTHSNYVSENRQKSYVISAGRKLWSRDRHIGYLLVDISYDYINSRFGPAVLDGSTLLIMDDQGGLVYDSNSVKAPADTIYGTEFKEIMGHLGTGRGQTNIRLNGHDYLAIYQRSDFTDWTTVALMPMDLILKNVSRTLNMAVLLSLICLGAGILLIGRFSTIHTRNIMKLKNCVDQADAGNLNALPALNSGDEVDALLASFNEMIKRVNQLMKDLEDRKQRERQAEFQALYAQISPHFLSNTLNTVSWMADRQNAGNISAITTSLITLLHYSMKNKHEVVLLREEIEYVKNYLTIQEYRYYGMFEVSYAVEPEVAGCKVLKFMLQPLVENSIMHGISKLQKQGRILIQAGRRGRRLVIVVADNGVGFSEESYKQHKTHHIGLDNVRERISLFYGDEYFLRIESKEHYYTKVTIELPFIREECGGGVDDASFDDS